MTSASRCAWCATLLVMGLALTGSGCGGGTRTGTTDPEAKLRLEHLLRAWNAYVDNKQKTPASEDDLKNYLRKLSAKDREKIGLPEDFEKIFTSPRDGAKYVVRYGMPRLDAGGDSQPIAWEQNGAGGKRFVALNVGYVEEYEDAAFNALKK